MVCGLDDRPGVDFLIQGPSRMKTFNPVLASLCLVGALSGASTEAIGVAFLTPSETPVGAIPFTNWGRATPDTTYQQWRGPSNGGTPALAGGGENFTTIFGINAPDNDHYNPIGTATAEYLDEDRNSTGVTSGFLIAGNQNSYSFFASADWELIVPDYGYGDGVTTTVILQMEISGNELLIGSGTPSNPTAPNTVKLDGFDWVDHVELSRSPAVGGGFNTFDVTHWFRFELLNNDPVHVLEFDSYDPSLGVFDDLLHGHMSTLAIAVDTYAPLSVIEGDLSGDGFVGIDDLGIVLGNWNQNVPPADPLADPSGDGFVGIDDLNLVLANWNSGTPPATSNVPEPAGLVISCLLSVPLLSRRRTAR